MKIQHTYRCPYCGLRGTVGVIAADLHALLHLESGSVPVEEEIEWPPNESRGVFVFDPGRYR